MSCTMVAVKDNFSDKTVALFESTMDAREYIDARSDLYLTLVEVDENGFEVDEDYDEDYEPYDIDSDFGFDPYMGEYTYDC